MMEIRLANSSVFVGYNSGLQANNQLVVRLSFVNHLQNIEIGAGMRFSFGIGSLLSLLCLVTVVGCAKSGLDLPTGTVAGAVTLNGEPMANGTITFFGENHGDTATAKLQSDGTYTLKYGDGFSVPAGDYRVAIVDGAAGGGVSADPSELMKTVAAGPPEKSALDSKYVDPQTSGLVAVVKEGTNTNINFDLK